MAKSYYAILGISPGASQDDVKSAYRRLAKELHPDRFPGESRPFQDVQEAYAILGEPAKRRRYDEETTPWPASPSMSAGRGRSPEPLIRETTPGRRAPEPFAPEARPADLGDISPIRSFHTFTPSFDEIYDWLWEHLSSLNRTKSAPVKNLSMDVPLTPAQCAHGGHARILVPARAICPTCRGHGGVGPYVCRRCDGEGAISGEAPVFISYPAGLSRDHAVVIPLERYGIKNLYVKVVFRPSDS